MYLEQQGKRVSQSSWRDIIVSIILVNTKHRGRNRITVRWCIWLGRVTKPWRNWVLMAMIYTPSHPQLRLTKDNWHLHDTIFLSFKVKQVTCWLKEENKLPIENSFLWLIIIWYFGAQCCGRHIPSWHAYVGPMSVNVGKVGIKKRTLNRRLEGRSQFLNVVRTFVNSKKYNS